MTVERRKQSPSVTRQLADLLAAKGALSEPQFMDMRTRIMGEQQAKSNVSLTLLHEGIGSTIALIFRNAMNRTAISAGGKSREEVTEILKSSEFGEPKEVPVGIEYSEKEGGGETD